MKKTQKRLIQSSVLQALVYRLIRWYAATFRLTVIGEKQWLDHVQNGGRAFYAPRISNFFPPFGTFRTTGNSRRGS
ncbi:MAG: hypothetical protein R2875_13740 [Desulfobacterales bacterium]